jgi:hypothetical protein
LVTVQTVQIWRFAIQTTLHCASGDEMRRSGTVVSATGAVLLGAAAKF